MRIVTWVDCVPGVALAAFPVTAGSTECDPPEHPARRLEIARTASADPPAFLKSLIYWCLRFSVIAPETPPLTKYVSNVDCFVGELSVNVICEGPHPACVGEMMNWLFVPAA
jgi:hypothetical protein